MSALGGEIGKIAAFAPGSEIRRSDIDAVTEPVLDAVVFQMTDALGAGDYEGALKKLQVLYQMQQEPISILGAVGAHLRRISTARILIDAGKGGDELMKICGLKDYAARRLTQAVPGLRVLTSGGAPHILPITLPGYKSEVVVRFLSDRGVYVSSGSACHKGKASHVVSALGLDKKTAAGVIRVRFGPETTFEEIDALHDALLTHKNSRFPML